MSSISPIPPILGGGVGNKKKKKPSFRPGAASGTKRKKPTPSQPQGSAAGAGKAVINDEANKKQKQTVGQSNPRTEEKKTQEPVDAGIAVTAPVPPTTADEDSSGSSRGLEKKINADDATTATIAVVDTAARKEQSSVNREAAVGMTTGNSAVAAVLPPITPIPEKIQGEYVAATAANSNSLSFGTGTISSLQGREQATPADFAAAVAVLQRRKQADDGTLSVGQRGPAGIPAGQSVEEKTTAKTLGKLSSIETAAASTPLVENDSGAVSRDIISQKALLNVAPDASSALEQRIEEQKYETAIAREPPVLVDATGAKSKTTLASTSTTLSPIIPPVVGQKKKPSVAKHRARPVGVMGGRSKKPTTKKTSADSGTSQASSPVGREGDRGKAALGGEATARKRVTEMDEELAIPSPKKKSAEETSKSLVQASPEGPHIAATAAAPSITATAAQATTDTTVGMSQAATAMLTGVTPHASPSIRATQVSPGTTVPTTTSPASSTPQTSHSPLVDAASSSLTLSKNDQQTARIAIPALPAMPPASEMAAAAAMDETMPSAPRTLQHKQQRPNVPIKKIAKPLKPLGSRVGVGGTSRTKKTKVGISLGSSHSAATGVPVVAGGAAAAATTKAAESEMLTDGASTRMSIAQSVQPRRKDPSSTSKKSSTSTATDNIAEGRKGTKMRRTADTTTAGSTEQGAIVPQILPPTLQQQPVPYQHWGLLDPALNIPQPKPGEKTMKDFCSKFKDPNKKRRGRRKKEERQQNENDHIEEKKDGDNSTTHGDARQGRNNETGAGQGGQTTGDNANDDSARSGPIVEIINGEIVIKQSSIVVGARRTTEEVDREFENNVVVEDNTAVTATYTSFTGRQRPQHWSVEETQKFYRALRQCGTDFTIMASFFENRTRKQLKRKYLDESKKNPNLVHMALDPNVQIPLDLSVFGPGLKVDKSTVKSMKKKSSTNVHNEQTSSSGTSADVLENGARKDAVCFRPAEAESTPSPPSGEELPMSAENIDKVHKPDKNENTSSEGGNVVQEQPSTESKTNDGQSVEGVIETGKEGPSKAPSDNLPAIPLAPTPGAKMAKAKRPKFKAKPKPVGKVKVKKPLQKKSVV